MSEVARAEKAEKEGGPIVGQAVGHHHLPLHNYMVHQPWSGCTGTEEEECNVKAYILSQPQLNLDSS